MQTLTTTKKSKSTTASAFHNNKGQPFFAAVKVQPKLTIGAVDDPYEREADAVSEQVMRMPVQQNSTSGSNRNSSHFFARASISNLNVQRECSSCEKEKINRRERKPEEEEKIQKKSQGAVTGGMAAPSIVNDVLSSGGQALDSGTRSFFEPRFGHDFSRVRIHTGPTAAKSAQEINAVAYTAGANIVFNQNQFSPASDSGKKLLAHELAHVVQQENNASPGKINRTVELRPPGRGEASAFDRRQEIVDRLNRLSTAVSYTLNDRVLQYELIEGATQSYFDRQMIAFIDSAPVIPLRLITSSGLVGDRRSGFSSLLIDSFMSGYLDLEDMMRSDDNSFQMNLLHILTERSRARNYARRIGTPGLSPIDASGAETPEFRRAHQAGIDSETSYLQDIFSDPTIRFIRETLSGYNLIFTFRSAERYRIIHTFRRQSRNVSGGTVVVINTAGETVSVSDFIAQREAAAAVAEVEAP